jgi:predicted neuraminidase
MSLFVGTSDTFGPPWKRVQIDETPPFHRLDEPTIYEAADGTAHMVIRDGAHSGKLVRSVSRDGGRTWSKPVHTNYPDATSKNVTGRLSDGRYYLINNPDPKSRDPLAITLSPDGWVFGAPAVVRKDAPERRFEGRAKGNRSLQYPHALEHGKSLWVIYSTNKEDIDITEIKLSDLRNSPR